MKRIAAILLTASCIAVWPAGQPNGQAFAMTGHELQNRCRDAIRLIRDPESVPPDSPDFADATLCLGFVQGAGDAGALLGELDSSEVAALRNCTSAAVTAEEMVRLVMRHLEEKPEDANLSGVTVVMIALHDAFPCNPG